MQRRAASLLPSIQQEGIGAARASSSTPSLGLRPVAPITRASEPRNLVGVLIPHAGIKEPKKIQIKQPHPPGTGSPAHCSIFAGERVLIGRESQCTIRINDMNCAKFHALVSASTDGELIAVEEINSIPGSSHGVWLNGVRLKTRMKRILVDGDIIRVERDTDYRFRFHRVVPSGMAGCPPLDATSAPSIWYPLTAATSAAMVEAQAKAEAKRAALQVFNVHPGAMASWAKPMVPRNHPGRVWRCSVSTLATAAHLQTLWRPVAALLDTTDVARLLATCALLRSDLASMWHAHKQSVGFVGRHVDCVAHVSNTRRRGAGVSGAKGSAKRTLLPKLAVCVIACLPVDLSAPSSLTPSTLDAKGSDAVAPARRSGVKRSPVDEAASATQHAVKRARSSAGSAKSSPHQALSAAFRLSESDRIRGANLARTFLAHSPAATLRRSSVDDSLILQRTVPRRATDVSQADWLRMECFRQDRGGSRKNASLSPSPLCAERPLNILNSIEQGNMLASAVETPLPTPGGRGAMSAVGSAVLAFFESYADVDSGGSLVVCVEVLAGQGITEANVRKTVEILTRDAYLYATTGGAHFAATLPYTARIAQCSGHAGPTVKSAADAVSADAVPGRALSTPQRSFRLRSSPRGASAAGRAKPGGVSSRGGVSAHGPESWLTGAHNSLLVTGASDGTINFWHSGTSLCVGIFKLSKRAIRAMTWFIVPGDRTSRRSSAGRSSAGRGSTVLPGLDKLWKLNSGELLTLKTISRLRLVTGNEKGTVKVWGLDAKVWGAGVAGSPSLEIDLKFCSRLPKFTKGISHMHALLPMRVDEAGGGGSTSRSRQVVAVVEEGGQFLKLWALQNTASTSPTAAGSGALGSARSAAAQRSKFVPASSSFYGSSSFTPRTEPLLRPSPEEEDGPITWQDGDDEDVTSIATLVIPEHAAIRCVLAETAATRVFIPLCARSGIDDGPAKSPVFGRGAQTPRFRGTHAHQAEGGGLNRDGSRRTPPNTPRDSFSMGGGFGSSFVETRPPSPSQRIIAGVQKGDIYIWHICYDSLQATQQEPVVLRHSTREPTSGTTDRAAVTSLVWVPTSFKPRRIVRANASDASAQLRTSGASSSSSSPPPIRAIAATTVSRPPPIRPKQYRPIPINRENSVASVAAPGRTQGSAPLHRPTAVPPGGVRFVTGIDSARTTSSLVRPAPSSTFTSIDSHEKRSMRAPNFSARREGKKASIKVAKINVETAMAQSQMRDTVLDVESGPPAVLLASASADGLVRLWDLRSLVCVVQFQAHSDFITCMRCLPDPARQQWWLITGSVDRTRPMAVWGVHHVPSVSAPVDSPTNIPRLRNFSPPRAFSSSSSGRDKFFSGRRRGVSIRPEGNAAVSPGISPRHAITASNEVRLPQRKNALDGVVIADSLEHFPDQNSGRDSTCRSVTPTPRGGGRHSPFFRNRRQAQRRPATMEGADFYVSADRFVFPTPGIHGEVWDMAMTEGGMAATIAPLTGSVVHLTL